MYEELLVTTCTKYIHNMFNISFKKEWYDTYWCFDLHSTIIKSSYDLNDKSVDFYPFAKEVMQLLTERNDIKLIMWTSSYPKEIDNYNRIFEENGIHFDTINENPNISSNNGNFGYYEKKFYFNILFDDKGFFNPLEDWEPIYNLLIKYQEDGFLPNPNWTTKY